MVTKKEAKAIHNVIYGVDKMKDDARIEQLERAINKLKDIKEFISVEPDIKISPLLSSVVRNVNAITIKENKNYWFVREYLEERKPMVVK